MSPSDHPGWAAVEGELADALERLRRGDAITIKAGGDRFVQFFWPKPSSPPTVTVEAGIGGRGSAAEAALAALGWPRWAADPSMNVAMLEVPARPDPATAARLAGLMVRALRDVYGVADPAELTYTSFSDGGLRAPRLRTIAAGAGQPVFDDPDPVTVLPAPSARWQRWCTLLADGLDGWSHAAFDRLVEEHGWQESPGDRRTAYDTGDGERVSADGDNAGRHGHGEISAVTVALPVAVADVASEFRQALAAAVSVFGHPPLVGDELAVPFARWRGERISVRVAAHLRGGEVNLRIEPTQARENIIYNFQKWMMTPDEWSPDELWMTEPDVAAPQAKALEGMLLYTRSPETTLDDAVDELKLLFRSWSDSLPLLYPYASSANWQLRRTDRHWTVIAEGRFTPERVTARFGSGDQFGERLNAAPGTDVVADLTARVREALARAGATTVADVRGRVWSDTPAERLWASWFTFGTDQGGSTSSSRLPS